MNGLVHIYGCTMYDLYVILKNQYQNTSINIAITDQSPFMYRIYVIVCLHCIHQYVCHKHNYIRLYTFIFGALIHSHL